MVRVWGGATEDSTLEPFRIVMFRTTALSLLVVLLAVDGATFAIPSWTGRAAATTRRRRRRRIGADSKMPRTPQQKFSPSFHRQPTVVGVDSRKPFAFWKLKSSTREHDTEAVQPTEKPNRWSSQMVQRAALPLWLVGVSAFMIVNYSRATSCWPAFLVDILPYRAWSLIHAVAAMLFSGTIITTTVLEWLVVDSPSKAAQQFWFAQHPSAVDTAETVLVLPGLTALLVSGVAQARLAYQLPLQLAPLHVKLPLHVLVAFGIWWVATDLSLRGADAANSKQVQIQRRWSNVVSCLFVLALYGIMVLKPGR